MAASAPIQFTVDQEALKVADTNVARANASFRKRAVGAASNTYSAVPRSPTSETNGQANGSVEPKPRAEEADAGETQSEDDQKTSEERENDIYSQKVLQCSIENKEACLMCQG